MQISTPQSSNVGASLAIAEGVEQTTKVEGDIVSVIPAVRYDCFESGR